MMIEASSLSNDKRQQFTIGNSYNDKLKYNLVARSVDIQHYENFPQGCLFSPDGLCLLTATVGDSKLRLYNTPTSLLASTRAGKGIIAEAKSAGDASTTNPDADDHNNKNDGNNEAKIQDINESVEEMYKPEIIVEEWKTALTTVSGDSVRSYAWYPHMSSNNPISCCFVAVSRDSPIHLYDAYTGSVRASYCPYNALDEMESPTVVTFSPDGQKIISGGFRTDRSIYCFDTSRPGRDATSLFKLGKTRRSSDGQKGFVSAIDFQRHHTSSFDNCTTHSSNRIFAVGTYSPGSIYVYDDRVNCVTQQPMGTILTGACIVGHGKGYARKKRRFTSSAVDSKTVERCIEDPDCNDDNIFNNDNNWFSSAKAKWIQSKTIGGVSQLKFSPKSEYYLYSTSRRSNTILAWDLRMLSGNIDNQSNPIQVIGSFESNNDTNQRIEFDFDGGTLFVGGQDCCIRVYDCTTGNLKGKIDGFNSTVNAVSFFRGFQSNKPILAAACGSRYFPPEEIYDDASDGYDVPVSGPIGSLSLFTLGNV